MSDRPAHAPDLIAGFWTIAGAVRPWSGCNVSPHPIESRVGAATAAGYVGIGFYYDDLDVIEHGLGFDRLRGILQDNGIRYGQFEGLDRWWTVEDVHGTQTRDTLLRAVEALEIPDSHVKCIADTTGAAIPMDAYAAGFGSLAEASAGVGARLGIEFIPFAGIATLADALELVGAAGHPDAGVVIDLWHVARNGIPFADIAAVPKELIVNVELDDADDSPVGRLEDDTVDRRRFCGEGDIDVRGFIESIRATGYRGAYAVEVISEETRALPLDAAARRSYTTTAAQFA